MFLVRDNAEIIQSIALFGDQIMELLEKWCNHTHCLCWHGGALLFWWTVTTVVLLLTISFCHLLCKQPLPFLHGRIGYCAITLTSLFLHTLILFLGWNRIYADLHFSTIHWSIAERAEFTFYYWQAFVGQSLLSSAALVASLLLLGKNRTTNDVSNPLERLRASRAVMISITLVSALLLLFFNRLNAVTKTASVWLLFLSEAIPFLLIILSGMYAIRIHLRIARKQEEVTEQEN
jgi:hypothetical protein